MTFTQTDTICGPILQAAWR